MKNFGKLLGISLLLFAANCEGPTEQEDLKSYNLEKALTIALAKERESARIKAQTAFETEKAELSEEQLNIAASALAKERENAQIKAQTEFETKKAKFSEEQRKIMDEIDTHEFDVNQPSSDEKLSELANKVQPKTLELMRRNPRGISYALPQVEFRIDENKGWNSKKAQLPQVQRNLLEKIEAQIEAGTFNPKDFDLKKLATATLTVMTEEPTKDPARLAIVAASKRRQEIEARRKATPRRRPTSPKL